MKRLLILNIRTDADDTALGFTTTWINRLADRCEKVVVITMHAGRLELRPNVEVYSLGRELGISRVRSVGRFYRAAWQAIRSDRVDACFAHMTPLLLILLWPLAWATRLPTLLWYAHGAVSNQLRIAERLADRCVTSTPSGFRLRSDKLYVLGQGIDTDQFRPVARDDESTRRIISVGRITPSKNIELMIRSFRLLRDEGKPVELEIVGGPFTDEDAVYYNRCRRMAMENGIPSIVFRGPVSHRRVNSVYQRGGVFLNLGQTGSLDKAILEAMASGCVPVSSNDSFAAIAHASGLDMLACAAQPDAIASALTRILTMPDLDRKALEKRCRRLVVEKHGLTGLLDQIVRHLDSLTGGEGRGPAAPVKASTFGPM